MLASFKTLLGKDWGIFQTVAQIKQNLRVDLRDPEARLRLLAESIIGQTPERNEHAEVGAVFKWTLNHFRYASDPVDIELLKTPLRMYSEVQERGYFVGDCDDVVSFLSALLLSIGYVCQLVVIVPENSPSNEYQHIFLRVWFRRTSEWVTLEACARHKPMGWEAPHKFERAWELRP